MSSSSPPRDEPADDAWLRLALIQQLESLQVAGVLEMAPPTARQLTSAPSPALPDGPDMENSMKSSTNSQSLFNDSMTAQTDMGLDERRRQLNVLQHEVSSCTCCDELVDNRTKTVFGVGNPQARLVFFGEAPGADEDQQGEPFVGRAGKLLNDIISQGMGLTRSDVYIMNVVKCRPPGNRNPTSAEAVNCRPFFERQFEIIRPEFICCLGAVAAATLLAVNVSIGSLRGCLHNYRVSAAKSGRQKRSVEGHSIVDGRNGAHGAGEKVVCGSLLTNYFTPAAWWGYIEVGTTSLLLAACGHIRDPSSAKRIGGGGRCPKPLLTRKNYDNSPVV